MRTTTKMRRERTTTMMTITEEYRSPSPNPNLNVLDHRSTVSALTSAGLEVRGGRYCHRHLRRRCCPAVVTTRTGCRTSSLEQRGVHPGIHHCCRHGRRWCSRHTGPYRAFLPGRRCCRCCHVRCCGHSRYGRRCGARMRQAPSYAAQDRRCSRCTCREGRGACCARCVGGGGRQGCWAWTGGT
jgi:hypothetical protein